MKNKSHLNSEFSLTYEECIDLIKSLPGLVVTNRDGLIRYISSQIISDIEELEIMPSPDGYVGKLIDDVHPTSKIPNVIRTGREEKFVFYLEGGIPSVARIIPIYKGGAISGVIDYDIFSNENEISEFVSRVNEFVKQGHISLNVDSVETDISMKYTVSSIIGNSPKIKALKQQIYNVSEGNSTVLITGETGSGKELVAHAIHSLSTRKKAPFIEVNCAAIPEALFESELFGYESGSFTGGRPGGRRGKFEIADKGTIFLDEIDQIPYNVQPKLFRVLQEGEIDRIGSNSIPVDVRIIATTNKDLKNMVANHTFREDMYYRLNVISIEVPPLRERKEDISLIAAAQIKRLNGKLNRNVEGISDEVFHLFENYNWPGNVRELVNVLERSMINCRDDLLEPVHLGRFLVEMLSDVMPDTDVSELNTLDEIVGFAERAAIERALEINDYNKTKAARLLNITRPSLYNKMNKYGIKANE